MVIRNLGNPVAIGSLMRVLACNLMDLTRDNFSIELRNRVRNRVWTGRSLGSLKDSLRDGLLANLKTKQREREK